MKTWLIVAAVGAILLGGFLLHPDRAAPAMQIHDIKTPASSGPAGAVPRGGEVWERNTPRRG